MHYINFVWFSCIFYQGHTVSGPDHHTTFECFVYHDSDFFFQAMKTYHTYQTESKQAESKLRTVECQKNKLEQQLAGKNISSNKKLKSWIRQTEKVRFLLAIKNISSNHKLKAFRRQTEKVSFLLAIKNISSNRKLKAFSRQTEKVGPLWISTPFTVKHNNNFARGYKIYICI